MAKGANRFGDARRLGFPPLALIAFATCRRRSFRSLPSEYPRSGRRRDKTASAKATRMALVGLYLIANGYAIKVLFTLILATD